MSEGDGKGGRVFVAVGSKNPTKTAAAVTIFAEYFTGGEKERVDLQAVDVPSGVSDTPITDVESVTGAVQRAKAALAAVSAEESERVFGVGLEAGLQCLAMQDGSGIATYAYFLSTWGAVVDTKGVTGYGSSQRFRLTDKIIGALGLPLQGKGGDALPTAGSSMLGDIKPLMHKLTGVESIGTKQGIVSVLTDGHIDREGLNEAALRCALIPFTAPAGLL